MLVPTSPDDPAAAANRKAWEVLNKWEKPFLCAFGDSDPITKGGDKVFIATVPGTKNQPHTTIAGGGHFIQEDRGEELAKGDRRLAEEVEPKKQNRRRTRVANPSSRKGDKKP